MLLFLWPTVAQIPNQYGTLETYYDRILRITPEEAREAGIKERSTLKRIKDRIRKGKKLNPKITRNSVSDVLRELREKGLVVCINEEEKKGRIYRLTGLGDRVRNYVLQ